MHQHSPHTSFEPGLAPERNPRPHPMEAPHRLTVGTTTLVAIPQRSAAVMSAGELAQWAQIGRNSVTRLVADHGIRELTGGLRHQRYSVAEVLTHILKVTSEDAADWKMLLVPLQTTEWVARMTGMSRSVLSERARQGELPFRVVNLFHTSARQAAPRGRRWIAAQVAAHLVGSPIPFMERDDAYNSSPSSPAGNGFAALWPSNAGEAHQCQR